MTIKTRAQQMQDYIERFEEASDDLKGAVYDLENARLIAGGDMEPPSRFLMERAQEFENAVRVLKRAVDHYIPELKAGVTK